MYAALGRWKVSPNVAANLVGLMTDEDPRGAALAHGPACEFSRAAAPPMGPGDPSQLLTGLDDQYHGSRSAPATPPTAEAEADRPLVDVIGSREVARLSTAPMRNGASISAPTFAVRPRNARPLNRHRLWSQLEDSGLAEQIEQTKTTGLEDGTKFEARGEGRVVVDSFFSYLLDPEDASWVVGDDDQEMPPAGFPTTAAAFGRGNGERRYGQERKRRREEALRRRGSRKVSRRR